MARYTCNDVAQDDFEDLDIENKLALATQGSTGF